MSNCADNTNFVPANVLLANIETVKKESYIDQNVDSESIRVAMIFIQDYIIEHVTGTCLMNQLKYLVCCNLIDDPVFCWYRQLLDEYIFKIIVHGVMSDLAPNRTFKERNQGIIRNNDPNLSYPILNEVKYIKGQYDRKLDFYINRAVNWIRCNKEHFDELCGCSCVCDCGKAPFNKPYSIGINLDIVYNNNRRR